MNNVLWKTVVGSHMWDMQRPDSDLDLFVCFVVPTEDILSGRVKFGTATFVTENNVDTQTHEIGKVIDMLLKGNINYMHYVLSPKIIVTSKWHEELKEILVANMAKNIYHSTKGCIHGVMHRYIMGKQELTDKEVHKKFNQVYRLYMFAEDWLLNKRVSFRKVNEKFSYDKYEEVIKKLDEAYEKSELPETPPEEPFRDLLLRVRLEYLSNRSP